MSESDTAPPDGTGSAGATYARLLFDDARRRGVSIAGRVAEEFVRGMPSLSGPAHRNGSTGPEHDEKPSGSARLRDAQVQAERAIDSALDALSNAFATCAELVDRAASFDATRSEPEVLVLSCRAGAIGSSVCWLHNTSDRTARHLRVHVGDLRSNDGVVLQASVRVEPAVVNNLGAGSSVRVMIVAGITSDAPPDRYHGLVFVQGIDNAPLRLVVNVASCEFAGDGEHP